MAAVYEFILLWAKSYVLLCTHKDLEYVLAVYPHVTLLKVCHTQFILVRDWRCD